MFEPNLTSNLIVDTLKKYLKYNNIESFLELGTGSGFITQEVFKFHKNNKIKIVTTDIMEESEEISKKNFINSGLEVDVRIGNLFEPILIDESFDVIVSDVASISETLNNFLPWYDGVPCNTGEDGLKLFNQILKKVKGHLNAGGCFIYPMISLSDTNTQAQKIDMLFRKTLTGLSSKWPLKIKDNMLLDCLDNLKRKKYCDFDIISGYHVFKTEVKISYI